MGILQVNDVESAGDSTEKALIAAAKKALAGDRADLVHLINQATVYVERSRDGRRLLLQRRQNGSQWVHAYSSLDRVPGMATSDRDVTWMTGAKLRAVIGPTVGITLDSGYPWANDVILPAVDPRQLWSSG